MPANSRRGCQFPTWYCVLYFGCTLDFMSRSCTCCRHDGQEVDRGAPRARDPCTNATAGRHTRNRTSHSKTVPLRGRSTGGAPARGRVLMRGAHRSRSSFPRASRGCAAQNRSVRQASSRIQTVSSLHRRTHRRIPVSTSRSTGRGDRRSLAASSRPTLASRGTYTARLRSSRTSGHHSRTASRNQARTARMTWLH